VEGVVAAPLGQGEAAAAAGGVEAGVEAEAPPAVKVEAPGPVISEELLEGFASKISASIREVVEGSNKVLLERLDRIEENVGKLRKEIRDLVSSMEGVIVEFREAISSLSNPFFAAPGGVPGGGLQAGSPQVPPGAAQGLEALVKSMWELVEKAGLETVEELIDEYVKAGLISGDEARKLKAIARTVARLRGRVDPQLLLPILAQAGGGRGEGTG
jgi:polyhydroxyalkanoate synthesis regulator phasin